MSARVVRDFRLATRGGPFRVALSLSLVVHLAALFFLGRGAVQREGVRALQQMHVRLVVEEPRPDPAAAAPAITPAIINPLSEQSVEPAAEPPVTPPASVPPPASTPAPVVSREPAPSQMPEHPALGSAPGREAGAPAAPPADAGAPGSPPPEPVGVADSPSPSINASAASVAVEAAPTPAAGTLPGTGPTIPSPATTPAGQGSGVSTAAPLAGDGLDAAGGAAAPAGATETVGASAGVRRGPAPRDLAAVQRRIDSRKVYPRIAVRNGWEGRVLVEMHLEGDGRLTDVRLLEGSGYPVLDDATIIAVRRASPFPPIARVLHVPVEYRLVP